MPGMWHNEVCYVDEICIKDSKVGILFATYCYPDDYGSIHVVDGEEEGLHSRSGINFS